MLCMDMEFGNQKIPHSPPFHSMLSIAECPLAPGQLMQQKYIFLLHLALTWAQMHLLHLAHYYFRFIWRSVMESFYYMSN